MPTTFFTRFIPRMVETYLLPQRVVSSHDSDRLGLRSAVQLALVGRYYERIGDHAVNMGERVTFMVTGWLPEHAAVARLEMKTRRGSPDA